MLRVSPLTCFQMSTRVLAREVRHQLPVSLQLRSRKGVHGAQRPVHLPFRWVLCSATLNATNLISLYSGIFQMDVLMDIGMKEGNVLFIDALDTCYLRLYGVGYMVKDHSDSERGNPLLHIGYSFRLAARVPLYASSHRQENTYHGLCYPSRVARAGTWRFDGYRFVPLRCPVLGFFPSIGCVKSFVPLGSQNGLSDVDHLQSPKAWHPLWY